MFHRILITFIMLSTLFHGTAFADLNPPSHPLFEGDAVHEIHLDFYAEDWWELLEDNYPDGIYLEASFDWEGTHFDSIGVRFKGGSSYTNNPTMKKSFKLDFDVFIEDQELFGLTKINLNCNFHDPSFIRERCCYEICNEAYLPTVRSNFVALYINDIYWGLYTIVEQYNSSFIEDHFGSGEDGNLWKGDEHGSLEYLGQYQGLYYTEYELKTNEEENDWSSLIGLTYDLNNTPLEYLPDTLSKTMDMNTALSLLAVDNLTVNLDSYSGRCGNYYLYQRDRDDLFVFSNWDLNEAWGIFNLWGLSISELQTLDPFWLSLTPLEYRPLGAVLWDFEEYAAVYTGHIRRLMAGIAHQDMLIMRMEELRDLIRYWVYAEQPPMSFFTPEQFENAMTVDIPIGPGHYAPALETFIRNRHDYLSGVLGTWNPVEGLLLNELMAKNDTTISDNYGEYDDWIEITNTGIDDINLSGFFLTDNMAEPFGFAFPDTIIQPGDYFIIWADGDPEQGSMHADFKLDADGEEVYLLDSAVVIDEVTFPELDADKSYGLWPDGTGEWEILSIATPGETNEGGTGMTRPSTGCTDEELQILLPNPLASTGVVTLHGDEGYARLDVFDMSGRLVCTPFEGHLFSTESFSWDVTSLSTGVYFLRLSQGEKMFIRRITVMR